MPKKGDKKPDSELSQTYAAIRMRKIRETRRLNNEDTYLQENRVQSKHYNLNWKNIRQDKPDYSDDPSFEELQKSKKEDKDKAPDNDSNTNEDNEDKDDEELLDLMLDEALQQAEVEKGKNYEKNKKKRDKKIEKLKQMKKGNKIPDDIIHTDVD